MGERRRAVRRSLALLALVVVAACSSTPQASPAGSGVVQPPSSGPSGTGAPPPSIDANDPRLQQGPSRAELINQAVDAGTIDEVTGLIYRAQSALAIPGVPDEYLDGVPRPDDGVFAAMATVMPTLSEADQARLRPYLSRPTEPDSVFHPAQTATVGLLEDERAGTSRSATGEHPTATCSQWSNSGDLDQRFKVWACADQDAQDAEIDIATVVALVAGIWDQMTVAAPDGMGPPKPDAYGTNVSADAGGDARIDFYLLNLGQVIYRGGVSRSVPADAAAAASPAAPYWDANGVAQKTSSGFVLLNRARLGDEVDMRQDVIHEFFHVLQFGHNLLGTHQGSQSHWFVEATAVWAETWYDRSHSDIPHSWFGYFQARPVGLEDPGEDHQYSAYIWPFFMQEEKDSTTIFAAWQAIDGVANGDFKSVTDKVNDQLSFKDNFSKFAVRNFHYPSILSEAGLEPHNSFDGNFLAGNWPPAHEQSGPVSPDTPYEPTLNTQPLAATYFHIDVTEGAREVIVSTQAVTPADQRAQDALVHIKGGSWETRPMNGGQLKFCRDDPGDDIDLVELIVSNTGRQGNLGGQARATAKAKCNHELHFGGTIHYDEYSRVFIPGNQSPDWERTITLAGTLNVVLLVSGSYALELSAERDGGSTYSYDYERKQSDGNDECTSHEEGVIETSGGVPDSFFGDWNIGRFNVIGGPGDDELDLDVEIRDWCGAQMGMDVPENERSHTFSGFPMCPQEGWLTADFDGSSSYVINCSYEYDRSSGGDIDVGNGHITGTLSPLDGPFPTPRHD